MGLLRVERFAISLPFYLINLAVPLLLLVHFNPGFTQGTLLPPVLTYLGGLSVAAAVTLIPLWLIHLRFPARPDTRSVAAFLASSFPIDSRIYSAAGRTYALAYLALLALTVAGTCAVLLRQSGLPFLAGQTPLHAFLWLNLAYAGICALFARSLGRR